MTAALPRLYLVTDTAIISQPGFAARASEALQAGGSACALQLRAHGLSGRALWRLAAQLRPAARQADASLWINDRIDVALAVRADGVQLGAASLATGVARRLLGRSVRLGRSIHSAADARSQAEGCDLLVLGSIYATASHPGRVPLGTAELASATGVGRPIVAIGGITPERVKEVVDAGAWGVAIRSGAWEAPHVADAVERYLRALSEVEPGLGEPRNGDE